MIIVLTIFAALFIFSACGRNNENYANNGETYGADVSETTPLPKPEETPAPVVTPIEEPTEDIQEVNAGTSEIVLGPFVFTSKIAGNNQVHFAWMDISGRRGFRVEQSDSPDGPWELVANMSPSRRVFHQMGLENNRTYWYRIGVITAGGTFQPTIWNPQQGAFVPRGSGYNFINNQLLGGVIMVDSGESIIWTEPFALTPTRRSDIRIIDKDFFREQGFDPETDGFLGMRLPGDWRPFNDESHWNTPLAVFEERGELFVLPNSLEIIDTIISRANNGNPRESLAFGPFNYSFPIFVVNSENVEGMRVQSYVNWPWGSIFDSWDKDHDFWVDEEFLVPLTRDMWSEQNEDGHLIIIDPFKMIAWEFSRFIWVVPNWEDYLVEAVTTAGHTLANIPEGVLWSVVNETLFGTPVHGGRWGEMFVNNKASYNYFPGAVPITSTFNIWDLTGYGTGVPFEGRYLTRGGRGSGFGNLPGLIRPEQIKYGIIDHALVFTFQRNRAVGPDDELANTTAARMFAFPGARSDGMWGGQHYPIQGSALRLPAWVSEYNFDDWGLCEPSRVIARALRDFGMYNSDNGGNFKIFGQLLHPDDSIGIAEWEEMFPGIFENVRRIPVHLFEVVLTGQLYTGARHPLPNPIYYPPTRPFILPSPTERPWLTAGRDTLTQTPPEAVLNELYSFQLIAVGDRPITWELIEGSLPEGLYLSESGLILGVLASYAESAYFTVRATNEAGSVTSRFIIEVQICEEYD